MTEQVPPEEELRLLKLKIALWYDQIHRAISNLPAINFKVVHTVLDEMALNALASTEEEQ